MVMDYLHAGYVAAVRWRSDSDETATIRWYRAAPGAKVYTQLHAFGSTVWDEADEVASTGPGEVCKSISAWNPSVPNPPAGQSTPTPPAEMAGGASPACADMLFGHASGAACGCGYSLVST